MTVPNSFATVTSATGAQLDANFAACDQLNAANVRNTDGDQQVISQGTAKLRTGTCSVASGNLYTLLGSNVAVEYTSYNFAISSAGTFAPCDANGATWIRSTTAAGIESFYYIVGVGGVAPAAGSFTLEKSFNITTGVETINGSLSIPNATLAIAPATLSTQAVQASQLGNYLETIVTLGSAVNLSNGVAVNVATLNLTAGTWLVSGNVAISNGTVDTVHVTGISTTSATLPAGQDRRYSYYVGASFFDASPVMSIKVTGAVPVYLITLANFTGTTPTAYGHISAFRLTAF